MLAHKRNACADCHESFSSQKNVERHRRRGLPRELLFTEGRRATSASRTATRASLHRRTSSDIGVADCHESFSSQKDVERHRRRGLPRELLFTGRRATSASRTATRASLHRTSSDISVADCHESFSSQDVERHRRRGLPRELLFTEGRRATSASRTATRASLHRRTSSDIGVADCHESFSSQDVERHQRRGLPRELLFTEGRRATSASRTATRASLHRTSSDISVADCHESFSSQKDVERHRRRGLPRELLFTEGRRATSASRTATRASLHRRTSSDIGVADCHESFSSQKDVERHRRRGLPRELLFTGRRATSASRTATRASLHRRTSSDIGVADCHESFSSQKDVERHQRRGLPRELLFTEGRRATSASRTATRASLHRRTSSDIGVADCHESFSSQKDVERHRRREHGCVSDRAPAHACSQCARVFDRPGLLRDHQSTHTGEVRHECDVCHLAMKTAKALQKQQRSCRPRRGHAAPSTVAPI